MQQRTWSPQEYDIPLFKKIIEILYQPVNLSLNDRTETEVGKKVIFTIVPKSPSERHSFFSIVYSFFFHCLGPELSQSFCSYYQHWMNLHSMWDDLAQPSSSEFTIPTLYLALHLLQGPHTNSSSSAHEKHKILYQFAAQRINNNMWKWSKFHLQSLGGTENIISAAEDGEDQECSAPVLQLIVCCVTDYTIPAFGLLEVTDRDLAVS